MGEMLRELFLLQPTGAGASMSPGNQIRALTATNARANKRTIKAGRTVDRKNDTASGTKETILLMPDGALSAVEAATRSQRTRQAQPSR